MPSPMSFAMEADKETPPRAQPKAAAGLSPCRSVKVYYIN